MNRLSRYLFVECAQTSLVALGSLTFLVMLPQMLLLVDLWVNKGAANDVLHRMILYSIPQFMVGSLPMAILSGVLLALGRLAQDNELVIIKASGVSLWQLARPIGTLVAIFTLLSLLLNWIWVPRAFYEFTTLKKSLLSSTNALAMQPKTFNRELPGLTLYVDHQDPGNGILQGVLIHDQRIPGEAVTLTARRAHPHTRPDNKAALYLENGSRHWITPNGHYRQMQFATFDLGLDVVIGLIPQHKKQELDELGPAELHAVIQAGPPEQRHRALMEWHRRLAYPAATLIMGLLAIPLGQMQSQRSSRGWGFVAAVVILIVHFLLLAAGEALAGKNLLTPLAGFWLPNLLMAGFTLQIFARTARGRPFPGAALVTRGLDRWLLTRPPAHPAAPSGGG